MPDSVILWTRLAPEPLAFEQPLPEIVDVSWTVALDRSMRSVGACGSVAASNLLGHSVHLPVSGLRPGRTYYYQFRALGKRSRVGDAHVRDHEGAAVLSLADYRRRHALYATPCTRAIRRCARPGRCGSTRSCCRSLPARRWLLLHRSAANPHLKYFEGNRYGYDVYEVTARRFSTHMRAIGDRRDPASPVSTLTTFHVDRGKAGSYEDPATSGSPAQYRRPRKVSDPLTMLDFGGSRAL